MIKRDFILDMLAALPVWLWPLFLWEVYRVERYLRARCADGGGLVGLSVLKSGRIVITLDARNDREDGCDWTVLAPRAPWEKLDPDARAAALMARAGEGVAVIVAVIGLGAVMAGQGGGLASLPHVMVPP